MRLNLDTFKLKDISNKLNQRIDMAEDKSSVYFFYCISGCILQTKQQTGQQAQWNSC